MLFLCKNVTVCRCDNTTRNLFKNDLLCDLYLVTVAWVRCVCMWGRAWPASDWHVRQL